MADSKCCKQQWHCHHYHQTPKRNKEYTLSFDYRIKHLKETRLKVAGTSFQHFPRSGDYNYNHCILVNAKLMVSNMCPIIAEYVAVNLVAQ